MNTITEIQSKLDSRKGNMPEGVYLELCDFMKKMYLNEEKNAPMIQLKVLVVRYEIRNNISFTSHYITPIHNVEYITLTHEEKAKLENKLKDGKIVELPNREIQTKMVIIERQCEDDCGGESEGCEHHLTKDFIQERNVESSSYITYIFPDQSTTQSVFSRIEERRAYVSEL